MSLPVIFKEYPNMNNFHKGEQEIRAKYMRQADEEIHEELQALLTSKEFIAYLKEIAGKCGYKYEGMRSIQIRLSSGNSITVKSPTFLKAKPKKGKRKKNRKDVICHFGLEFLGFIERKSPLLASICTQFAVISPSFEIATKVLKELNIEVNHTFLRNLAYNFASEAMRERSSVALDSRIKQKGLRILICIDGGRVRERVAKKGRKKKNSNMHGFTTNWREPRLFTIHIVDGNGKIDKNFKPVYDGSLKKVNSFMDLLYNYLKEFNLAEACDITFCADGAEWMWDRIPQLAKRLNITNYNRVLDYTHAKQNLKQISDMLLEGKSISLKEYDKVSKQLKEYLWNGQIHLIKEFIESRAKYKRCKAKALKKLNNYFGDIEKFQYSTFKEKNIPIGSGTVESAIRRVLNLRIKGSGLFWLQENAEKIIFLRSQLLSGRWNIMLGNMMKTKRNRLHNREFKDLRLAA